MSTTKVSRSCTTCTIFHYELHKDAAVTAGKISKQQNRTTVMKQQQKRTSRGGRPLNKLNLSESLATFLSNRRGVCSLKRPLRSQIREDQDDDDEDSCCLGSTNTNNNKNKTTPCSGNDSYDFTALISDGDHDLDDTLVEEFSESCSNDDSRSIIIKEVEQEEESISNNNNKEHKGQQQQQESEKRQQALTALQSAIQAIVETADHLNLVKDKELVILCKKCNSSNKKKKNATAAALTTTRKQYIVTTMKHILHVEFQRTIMFQAIDALEQFVSDVTTNDDDDDDERMTDIDSLIDDHQESIACIHESLGNAAKLEQFEDSFNDWTLQDFYEEAMNRVQASSILKKKKKGTTTTTKKGPTTTTKKQQPTAKKQQPLLLCKKL